MMQRDYEDPLENFDLLRFAFKVTQGHWNRHASDFLLVIHRSMDPCLLTPQLREFPLEFCNGGDAQKTSHVPYQMAE